MGNDNSYLCNIKKVIMCQPSFFEVKYQINPWMKIGSVNRNKAFKQWLDLKHTYENLDIQVDVINQESNLPDMVFAADQGLPINSEKIIGSNFRHNERRGESLHYHKYLQEKGCRILKLSNNSFFEGGGDCLNYNGLDCYIGSGFRNGREAGLEMQYLLGKKVKILDLVDPRFYHLDTCFFILDRKTVFYYPPAFSKDSQTLINKDFDKVFEFEEQEIHQFAANSVIHRRFVITHPNNFRFIKKLLDLGYIPILVDVDEFHKAGGGIHCLSFIMQ